MPFFETLSSSVLIGFDERVNGEVVLERLMTHLGDCTRR